MQEGFTPGRGYERRWLGLAFIGISLIVISLDNTVLNVALPSIARTLGATATELQWIIDAYVLVFAALLLTTGAFGDRIGRKRALQLLHDGKSVHAGHIQIEQDDVGLMLQKQWQRFARIGGRMNIMIAPLFQR